jgi:hypothetical protein
MGLRRTLLRPVAFAAGVHARRQLGTFLRALERARETQDALLRRLVEAHAASDFGRDHGFSRIRTYEDFRSAVPIRAHEAFSPYVRRMLEGRDEALLPPGQKPLMFSMTSGSTGRPKHIPVSRAFLRTIRRGWNIFGLAALRDHPAAWLREIVTINSSMREDATPAGVPCGAISGLLAATQKRIVRRMYTVPRAVAEVDDPAVKNYAILRSAAGRDVAIIVTANPSTTIRLAQTAQEHVERLLRDISDGTFTPPGAAPAGLSAALRRRPAPALAKRLGESVRRDGRLMPRHLWRLDFLGNWTGGTMGLYLPRLRELYGDVPVRDIGLLASEGRFTVPLADTAPAGAAEITGNFLEFIQAEERERAAPGCLRAHELEIGREYFLIFSNWTGFFRYDLDDRVRVVGRQGETPVLEFLSRGSRTASITGEKLTEHHVVEAMRLACRRVGCAAVERFELQGRFADLPWYELRVEIDAAQEVPALAAAMDESLSQLNIEYRSKRASARLGPVRAVALPPGDLRRREDERVIQRRGRGEQYKHQYLLTEVIRG